MQPCHGLSGSGTALVLWGVSLQDARIEECCRNAMHGHGHGRPRIRQHVSYRTCGLSHMMCGGLDRNAYLDAESAGPDASGHPRVYFAIIFERPRIFKCVAKGFARQEQPGIKDSVGAVPCRAAGHGMHAVVLVEPKDGRADCNIYPGRDIAAVGLFTAWH